MKYVKRGLIVQLRDDRKRSFDYVAQNLGLNRRTVILHYRAQKAGVERLVDYHDLRSQERGFESHADERLRRLEKAGYASVYDYDRAMERLRAERPTNKIFSAYLGVVLQKKNMRPAQLAREVEISKTIVSKYLSAKTLPSPDTCKQIFEVLEIPYDSVEELVEGVLSGVFAGIDDPELTLESLLEADFSSKS